MRQEDDDLFGRIDDFLKGKPVNPPSVSEQGPVDQENLIYQEKKPHIEKFFAQTYPKALETHPRLQAQSFKRSLEYWKKRESHNFKLVGEEEGKQIVESIALADCLKFTEESVDESIRSMGRTENADEKRGFDTQVKRWDYWTKVCDEAVILEELSGENE